MVHRFLDDVADLLKALKDYGLEVEFDEKIGEILLPALVTHISIDYGDIYMIQGNIEIEYQNFSRKLYLFSPEKGDPFEIYLPRKVKAGFHNGYLWLIL
jgi:hypothetical protein